MDQGHECRSFRPRLVGRGVLFCDWRVHAAGSNVGGELNHSDAGFACSRLHVGFWLYKFRAGYPLDHLKIDQSFVRGIGESDRQEAIVTTIINLAHGLGLNTIAEGVDWTNNRRFCPAKDAISPKGIFSPAYAV